jgi:hypothetical protein
MVSMGGLYNGCTWRAMGKEEAVFVPQPCRIFASTQQPCHFFSLFFSFSCLGIRLCLISLSAMSAVIGKEEGRRGGREGGREGGRREGGKE